MTAQESRTTTGLANAMMNPGGHSLLGARLHAYVNGKTVNYFEFLENEMIAWKDYEIRDHRKRIIEDSTTNMMIDAELTIKILTDAMEYYRNAGKDGSMVRQDMMDYVQLDILEKCLTTMKDEGTKQKGMALLQVLKTSGEAKQIAMDCQSGVRSKM